MEASREEFGIHVARLQKRAWMDLLVKRATAGLFFGLLAAFLAAALAGTFRFPFAAAAVAAGLAGAGLAAGAISALASRVDRRRLLLQADSVLGSREIISTAAELEGTPGGTFTDAILQDAAGWLARTTPRAILGPRRLRLAPFAALAAVLTVAAVAFPVDLRTLFPRHENRDRELAQIGEDLRKNGEKLAEEAGAAELGRTLELSEQLAQLGKDLAARRITPEDALDRMSDLESGLAQEYQLRMQQVQPEARPGQPGSGPGQPGGPGTPGSSKPGTMDGAESTPPPGDKALSEMGNALDRLRQAERELGGQGGATDQAQVPSRPRRQRDPQGEPGGRSVPPGSGDAGQQGPPGQGEGPGGTGQGSGGEERPGDSGGSGVGSLPAPEKRGPASSIEQGGLGPGLQAQGNPAEGDSTKLLARALPEWTGSRLPEETILNQYSQQAESALARDEIPLKLRQSVKEYFTTIGISK